MLKFFLFLSLFGLLAKSARTQMEKKEDKYAPSLDEIYEKLDEMSAQTRNDVRHQKYSDYVNIFVKHFGKERTKLVGSSADGTKLRTQKDEGDYDYMFISKIEIPVENLEYRKDLPCFVKINGHSLGLPVRLINETYLPTSLLKEVSPIVFDQLRTIYMVVTLPAAFFSGSSKSVQLVKGTKPGQELTKYTDLKEDGEKELYSSNELGLDKKALRQNIQMLLEHKPLTAESKDILGVVIDFLHDIKPKDYKNAMIHQLYGDVIEAMEGVLTGTRHEDIDVCLNSTLLENQCFVKDKRHILEIFQKGDNNGFHFRNHKNEKQNINATYTRRSRMDFVAVFPLSGRPLHMEKWRQRQRCWPPTDVVQSIYDGEFFVGAKTALKNGNPETDFCISFASAEIKLNKALGKERRYILLLLKVFQRFTLVTYSDILTSFMWKTVLYWVSESREETFFSRDNAVNVIVEILQTMCAALKEGYLEHYFVPSNLFADLEESTRNDILKKLVKIKENPLEILQEFFKSENEANNHVKIQLPVKDISKKNPSRKSKKLSRLVDALESFNLNKQNVIDETLETMDNINVNEAIIDMAKSALEDMLKEREREMEENGNFDILEAPRSSVQDVLDKILMYLNIPAGEMENKLKAREALKHVALSCFMIDEYKPE